MLGVIATFSASRRWASVLFRASAAQHVRSRNFDQTPVQRTGIYLMRPHRVRAAMIASMMAGPVLLFSAPLLAQTAYDGLWNVTIYTHSGSCEPTSRYPLTVSDGRISAPGAEVAGKVGREGLVRVSIGPAYANGQLSGNTGSGKWNGASGGVPCSGRWEASRQ